MATIEDFDWVAEEHLEALRDSRTSAWEDQWPEFLGRYLDHRWSGWEQASDDDREQWLRPRVQALPLGWVTAEQRASLAQLSGRGDWRDWLPVQLDEWWAEWDQSTPDQLVPFLNDWLPSLTGVVDGADSADDPGARWLAWVTVEQQAHLDQHQPVLGDWRDWLPAQLDEWWPQWDQSTPDQLVPFLDEWLPTLATPANLDDAGDAGDAGDDDDIGGIDQIEVSPEEIPAEDKPATLGDPDNVFSLAWVTDDQGAQLDEMTEIRGDWHEWLIDEMTSRRPEWVELSPAELTAWLDDLIPLLVLPTDADALLGSLSDAFEQNPEMAALAAEFDEEELAQIIEQAFLTRAE
jgi:hypothetical protein